MERARERDRMRAQGSYEMKHDRAGGGERGGEKERERPEISGMERERENEQ